MPLGDVYPALTQGMIVVWKTRFLFSMGKSCMSRRNSVNGELSDQYIIMVGWRSVFSTLTPAQLDIIHQTAYEAGYIARKLPLSRMRQC